MEVGLKLLNRKLNQLFQSASIRFGGKANRMTLPFHDL